MLLPAFCASARCAPWASSSAAGSTPCSCSGRSARATLTYRKNDFPLHLPSGHQLQRVGRFLERKLLGDVGPQLALLVPGRDLLQALGEFLRLAPAEIAPEHAHHRRALEKRQVERQLRDLSRGEA